MLLVSLEFLEGGKVKLSVLKSLMYAVWCENNLGFHLFMDEHEVSNGRFIAEMVDFVLANPLYSVQRVLYLIVGDMTCPVWIS